MLRLILLLVLVSCGTHPIEVPEKTDEAFIPYIHEYQKATGILARTPVIMETLDEGVAGECHHIKRLIKINDLYWYVLSEEQREVLIMHELGHCDLKANHNDSTVEINNTTCPASVMRSRLMSYTEGRDCYRIDKNYYIQELINGTRNTYDDMETVERTFI